jgi:hypothetical protein
MKSDAVNRIVNVFRRVGQAGIQVEVNLDGGRVG